jgi:hypothetical protein
MNITTDIASGNALLLTTQPPSWVKATCPECADTHEGPSPLEVPRECACGCARLSIYASTGRPSPAEGSV